MPKKQNEPQNDENKPFYILMQLKCIKNEEQTGGKGHLKPWKWFSRRERNDHSKEGGRVGN